MSIVRKRPSYSLFSAVVLLLVFGCGGGDGSSDQAATGSSGTLSVNVTDAKPSLPAGTEEVFITFEEVLIHKDGGGWLSCPLVQSPTTIDLLQFQSGKTTELVPPCSLESGSYTQMRIVVSDAKIVIDGVAEPADLNVPSGTLKTDENFTFEVQGGGAVDLTVDFDLSQSIVVTGSSKYKLKPVLHIVQTQEAVTIQGSIDDATFGTSQEATVIVVLDKDQSLDTSPGDEEYTRVTVTREMSGDPAEFSIFWVVPAKDYVVETEVAGTVVFDEPLSSGDLVAGAIFDLNGNNPI